MRPGRELDKLIAERVFGLRVEMRRLAYDYESGQPDILDDEYLAHRMSRRSVGGPRTAEEVYKNYPYEDYAHNEAPPSYRSQWTLIPEYSTEIEAAWHLVERWGGGAKVVKNSIDSYTCIFFGPRYRKVGNIPGETAPHAICLAALATLEDA